ncbi:MAG: MFS transporter [Pyrinomonadaceae bacterium]|nr:MFS transporter [Pyrinomonadaceae bacterium]
MNLSYRELISQNRNFRNLLWGQTISELGNWFNFLAVLGLIRLISDESPIAASLYIAFRTIPFAVLNPIAGTFADRFSRKTILLASDILRGLFALVFLFATTREDLWIVFLASILVSSSSAFFEGAKNAATPNITGMEGLLSGTALMFSTRFVLMAIGAAFGGLVAALFGYKAAFLINSASFFVSAFSIWLIPAESMRERSPDERRLEIAEKAKSSFLAEIKEGVEYTLKTPLALTILMLNAIWAAGGGATNIVFEGLTVNVFSGGTMSNDLIYSILMTVNGIGLSIGVFIAHRVGTFVERKGITRVFIGWALILHGVLFAIGGLMPSLWLVALFVLLSRVLISAEYSVQETMFQRSLPDRIRGRISTLDRGVEITIFGLASLVAGFSLTIISAQLTTVIAGLVSGCAGVVWLVRSRKPGH